MTKRYVIDTVAFINYFDVFFEEEKKISKETRCIINKCFNSDFIEYKLIIPSIVLIEIFRKFLTTENLSKKFYYEIYNLLKESDDIEIKPIEKEVLEIFYTISQEDDLDIHDKIIYASAIQLECPLITNDPKIIKASKSDGFNQEIIF